MRKAAARGPAIGFTSGVGFLSPKAGRAAQRKARAKVRFKRATERVFIAGKIIIERG
jgi:hypothetical protein